MAHLRELQAYTGTLAVLSDMENWNSSLGPLPPIASRSHQPRSSAFISGHRRVFQPLQFEWLIDMSAISPKPQMFPLPSSPAKFNAQFVKHSFIQPFERAQSVISGFNVMLSRWIIIFAIKSIINFPLISISTSAVGRFLMTCYWKMPSRMMRAEINFLGNLFY